MKKYHARYEILLRPYQCWLNGLTKLAVEQGMCHSYIKNSHQLMVAKIRFSDTDREPAFVLICLYYSIQGRTFSEPLSAQANIVSA